MGPGLLPLSIMVSLTDIPREARISIGTVAAIMGATAIAVLIGAIMAKRRKSEEEEEEDRMETRYLQQEQTNQNGKGNHGYSRNQSMGMLDFQKHRHGLVLPEEKGPLTLQFIHTLTS